MDSDSKLLELPFELILDVWDALQTLSEKNAFTQTCSFAYENFNPRLYRHGVTSGNRQGVRIAVCLCGEATLKKMLDAGLDPNDQFWGEEPLLTTVVEAGLLENARVLIDAGADVNVQERFGNSATSLAVFNGHKDLLNLLFDRGASIDFRVYEEPPLVAAVQERHEDIVEILLAKGADVNEAGTQDAMGGTPLAWAARVGFESVFRRLLRAGAKTDFTSWDGRTLLHWAITGGYDRIVSILLEDGADPHVADNRGCTSLALACRARLFHRNTEIIKLLLQQNVDIDSRDNTSDTPLSHAAFRGYTEAVSLLLERNANPSVKNVLRKTPLYHAAQKGFTNSVFAILECAQQNEDGLGCESFIDEPDTKGRTPLFLATLYARKDIVEMLLYYGSSAKQTATCAGRTPLSVAKAQMETEHGAKCEDVQAIWDLLQQESVPTIDKERLNSNNTEWEDYEATCDACDAPISPYDMHFHCSICDEDNYDICQECVCSGESCHDRTHTWRKTIIVGDRWKEVSNSLSQDSIVDELANLSLQ